MPLTPADVHNVVFKKPPIGKRGYDEDDVDAFLDEVERELARLIEENNDLKAQLERGGGRGGPATGGSDADLRRMASENAELKAQVDRLRGETQRAEQALVQAQKSVGAGAGGLPGGAGLAAGLTGDSTGEQQALRVLMLAQRTADDHVADARREADKVLAEARSKAEELTRDARAKAEALERDARQRHQEAMGGLETKRSTLQKHIEGLKAFEREYRTRLKAYLESQLRELDTHSQAADAENAALRSSSSSGASALTGAFNGSGQFGLSDTADARGR